MNALSNMAPVRLYGLGGEALIVTQPEEIAHEPDQVEYHIEQVAIKLKIKTKEISKLTRPATFVRPGRAKHALERARKKFAELNPKAVVGKLAQTEAWLPVGTKQWFALGLCPGIREVDPRDRDLVEAHIDAEYAKGIRTLFVVRDSPTDYQTRVVGADQVMAPFDARRLEMTP